MGCSNEIYDLGFRGFGLIDIWVGVVKEVDDLGLRGFGLIVIWVVVRRSMV